VFYYSGHAIKELIDITNAAIHVSNSGDFYPGTSDRVVYITGTEGEVSLAQSLVWEMVGQQAFDDDSLTWEPSVAKENPGEFDSVEVEGKVAVPASFSGFILGKGGKTIQAIAQESSVSLSMDSKECGDLTSERVLSIAGTAASCMNCTSLVLAKLLEMGGGKFEYVQKGTTYPKSLGFSFSASSADNKGDRVVYSHESRDRGGEHKTTGKGRAAGSSNGPSGGGRGTASVDLINSNIHFLFFFLINQE
jgi:RNA-binding protein Nova